MKATFTYDKETKTLSARGGGMEWDVAVAGHMYVDIHGKPFSLTEEALMALDGTTEELKSPDGFEDVLNSITEEPAVSMGSSAMISGRGSGPVSVSNVVLSGDCLISHLHPSDFETPTNIKTFNTWLEAEAFVYGVEFVNETSIRAEVDKEAELPTVNIFDSDAITEEDPDV